MGASNYTYTEATWIQSLADWTGSHVRTFFYFGAVPHCIVPDNLLSGVTKSPSVEDRYDRKATIVTSQLPIKSWHDSMQDPTLADAILDWLEHNAYKVELKGKSMRKK